MSAGLRLAVGTLTIVPVRVSRVDRATAGRAMLLAPLVGLLPAAAATAVQALADHAGTGGFTAAVLAVAALAVFSRALHLDGLADVADGLGSGRPASQALAVMKASDIGPFGVLTLVLVMLTQIGCLAHVHQGGDAQAAAAVAVAVVVGRCAVPLGCLTGVPPARSEGLGAMTAGTVSPRTLAPLVVVVVTLTTVVGWWSGLGAWRTAVAAVAALAAAAGLLRRAVRRFGGITGDVLGAMVETATAVCLLVLSTG